MSSRDDHLHLTQSPSKHREGGGGGGGGVVEPSDGCHDEECKTPTSSDYKIPTVRSCPPTPKKNVIRLNNMKKRKRSEMMFFETTGREEVESFFRSNLVEDISRNIKKRCKSV
ncbi:hypothetical protein SLE2022_001790 [Rubroshorea leprosula]